MKLASYTYDVDGGNTQTFPRNHNKDNDVSCAGQWFANRSNHNTDMRAVFPDGVPSHPTACAEQLRAPSLHVSVPLPRAW